MPCQLLREWSVDLSLNVGHLRHLSYTPGNVASLLLMLLGLFQSLQWPEKFLAEAQKKNWWVSGDWLKRLLRWATWRDERVTRLSAPLGLMKCRPTPSFSYFPLPLWTFAVHAASHGAKIAEWLPSVEYPAGHCSDGDGELSVYFWI